MRLGLLLLLAGESTAFFAPGTSQLQRTALSRVSSIACGNSLVPTPWSQQTADDGKNFFYNSESGESVWQLPESVMPESWSCQTTEDGKAFFYNAGTGESVWEYPDAPAPLPAPPPAPPAAAIAAPSAPPIASDAAALKAELLTLINRLPERGAKAIFADNPPWEMDSILERVEGLIPLDPAERDGWMSSEAWCDCGGDSAAPWVLRYTSSRTFHLNEGATGYACTRGEVSTPELRMRVDTPKRDWLTLEEPIVRPNAEEAAAGDACVAECMWSAGGGDVLKVVAKKLRADGREWVPRSPTENDEVDMAAEKAIRVLALTQPVYLDDEMLVLRSTLVSEVVFVWTRLGADDPPPAEVQDPLATADPDEQAEILARALAERDQKKGKTFIRSGQGIPRYN